MARKYYDKLFTEYCIADMSLYKKCKFGLRWRTQKEVFEGKGQFKCGNQVCGNMEDLASYEMNFGYKERGEKKQALVKLRVCPDCAMKLNYRKLKEQEKEAKEARRLAQLYVCRS
jgi:protein FRA10AC1